MAKIAWLGLGAMGETIAAHLLGDGHELTVYNRSREKTAGLAASGARVAATPAEAARGAEFVIAMVRDDDASRDIWLGENGAAEALTAGVIAVDSSTVRPGWALTLRDEILKTGAAFFEAPVLGSRPQAKSRKLIALIAGNAELFPKVRDVYAGVSAVVHHVGEIGNGALFKLAINAQYATQVVIFSETLAMLARHGIAPSSAVDIINTAQSTSPSLQMVCRMIADKQFAPLFPIELVAKDLQYAVDVAREAGVDAEVLLSAERQFAAAAQNEELRDLNIGAIAKIYETAEARVA